MFGPNEKPTQKKCIVTEATQNHAGEPHHNALYNPRRTVSLLLSLRGVLLRASRFRLRRFFALLGGFPRPVAGTLVWRRRAALARIVGHIPSRAFELNRRRRKLSLSPTPALRTLLHLRRRDVFDSLEPVPALLALIFV
jgi:hypothetical protein